jgi:hypothetical protein
MFELSRYPLISGREKITYKRNLCRSAPISGPGQESYSCLKLRKTVRRKNGEARVRRGDAGELC